MDINEIVEDFIKVLENRESFDEVLEFYHPEIEQIEFPNTLTTNKTVRNYKELAIAAEKGKAVLKKETYKILKKYTFDNVVIIEAQWTGILAIPIGKLKPGDVMTAHFAQFYEFKDGKIIKQRNYDCFDPFK
ncbi:nuclear transport factor 2 family protein [Membranihabitans marinus]|uniref:nuclear transport factor 2 family protein n=1 Tax=Membranihabitans marinus TaxID=1227546 RepID=UPI001F2E84EC|nr:nuclear transport factor 2 family protein [Membranihabitans marinus]